MPKNNKRSEAYFAALKNQLLELKLAINLGPERGQVPEEIFQLLDEAKQTLLEIADSSYTSSTNNFGDQLKNVAKAISNAVPWNRTQTEKKHRQYFVTDGVLASELD